MRGLDQLLQARVRRQQLETQVIEAAKKAAGTIAEAIGQKIEFNQLGRQYDPYLVTDSSEGWCLALLLADGMYPHPQWGYQESRQFAIHVTAGLIEAMAGVLNAQIDEEEKAIGGFVKEPQPDPQIPMNNVSDESLITALQHSSDDISTYLNRDQQCIDCGTIYPPNQMPQTPDKCPTCGKSKTVVPVGSLPDGKPIVGRSRPAVRR